MSRLKATPACDHEGFESIQGDKVVCLRCGDTAPLQELPSTGLASAESPPPAPGKKKK